MIIRKERNEENPYSIINNWCLRDPLISAKAKGIFAYIMSLPDDWKFYASELEKHFTDGREAIASGLKELEENGYLRRDVVRDTGRFKSLSYTFYETPENSPQTAFPFPVKPIPGNTHLLNTNSLLSTNNTKRISDHSETNVSSDTPSTKNNFSGQETAKKEKKKQKREEKKSIAAPTVAHKLSRAFVAAFEAREGVLPVSFSWARSGAVFKRAMEAGHSEEACLQAIGRFMSDPNRTDHSFNYFQWDFDRFIRPSALEQAKAAQEAIYR